MTAIEIRNMLEEFMPPTRMEKGEIFRVPARKQVIIHVTLTIARGAIVYIERGSALVIL